MKKDQSKVMSQSRESGFAGESDGRMDGQTDRQTAEFIGPRGKSKV